MSLSDKINEIIFRNYDIIPDKSDIELRERWINRIKEEIGKKGNYDNIDDIILNKIQSRVIELKNEFMEKYQRDFGTILPKEKMDKYLSELYANENDRLRRSFNLDKLDNIPHSPEKILKNMSVFYIFVVIVIILLLLIIFYHMDSISEGKIIR